MHLPRLLESIHALEAPVFVLDSGSTDTTLQIAQKYQAEIKTNPFVNHPQQWDFALRHFNIETPWIIGLDADHIVSDELFKRLQDFKDENYREVNGIYFNRKNYFQGRWIRFGGYFPFYMLKMFRTGIGFSDLNEHMDHRFIVPGHTVIWKNGYLKEENLKENDLQFWRSKHERYSSLVAEEEVQRWQKLRTQTIKPNLWGNPDQQRAWLKSLWWKLPLGVRPYLYFGYRMLIKGGILEGKTGIRFHYLQGFWFRQQVDKKIKSIRKTLK